MYFKQYPLSANYHTSSSCTRKAKIKTQQSLWLKY